MWCQLARWSNAISTTTPHSPAKIPKHGRGDLLYAPGIPLYADLQAAINRYIQELNLGPPSPLFEPDSPIQLSNWSREPLVPRK